MKTFLSTISMIFLSIFLHAQVYKTIECTAGNLSNLLSATEKSTITNLTISGTIDSRDLKTMRDDMPYITYLDIQNSNILAYTGTQGTNGTSIITYPENEISAYSFSLRKNLEMIIMPENLTSIGYGCFSWCTAITNI
ncbi:MAG TPA: leucine-rich repeat protein, partial [Prolixibacteraceae bacterium]|nr:leucine-rich repeat protein [Prolixibacteraceae bacterium]